MESRMKVEELLPKVKSDSLKIDLLEAANRRLKKFEVANGRLRKYNGELRYALIEAQGQNPLIQIPDDGGGTHLFSNEPVEKVSQTLQICDAVVFNCIIMGQVFKNQDIKTLNTCRLVCTSWNEKASLILSRQNGGYGLAVSLKTEGFAWTEAFQLIEIQDLRSTIASAPQHWFSKALLDKSFTIRTESRSVLAEFGHCLRSIEITGWNFLFQDIHLILVDWCPNLEQLALPPRLIVQDGKNAPGVNKLKKEGYQKLVFNRPLKLTSLFMQEQLCISIVKASPNLKTLSLSCNSDKLSLQFFKELLHCPEITRNLENMKLNTGCKVTRLTEKISLFNSFQFSSKLKKLEIDAVGDFPANELSEALEKFGGSLGKLVLNLKTDMKVMKPELVFPRMDNLTELSYFNLVASPSSSIEFLTRMPNLKTLYLGEPAFGIINEEYFIDNLLSNCEKLRRNPRTKLKELYLFGVVQSPLATFDMMNTIFPNLTKLVVGIFVHLDDKEELKKYYTAVLDGGLSEMTNLKDLYLDFSRPQPDVEEEFDLISFIFKQLDKLSSLSDLKCLTVRDNSNSTTALVGEKLLEIPNLRKVTLIGLKLDWVTAKELTISLYNHNIQLEMEDTKLEEDFRILFEERLTFRHRKY